MALDVFTIREGKEGRKFWRKIGICSQNRDGSLNVYLDALPLDGVLHIREPRQFEDQPAAGTPQQSGQRNGYQQRGQQQRGGYQQQVPDPDPGNGDDIPF